MWDVDLERVCHAIRSATPALPERLSDADPLPAGTTLFIPTLWELNRVVFTENARLLADMQARGFRHARKLLRYRREQVVQCLLPLPDDYSANDVARAWTLTALLNLDGMDLFTARHLCDAEGITTLKNWRTRARRRSIASWTRLSRPHTPRPAALAEQGHGKRWRLAARMQ